jgi:hypothetical protein
MNKRRTSLRHFQRGARSPAEMVFRSQHPGPRSRRFVGRPSLNHAAS